jgi:hypothetical protein
MISSRTVLKCAVMGLFVLQMGCAAIWHELKPHRMQRLNRGPAPSIDPEFTLRQPNRFDGLNPETDSQVFARSDDDSAIVRAQSPNHVQH